MIRLNLRRCVILIMCTTSLIESAWAAGTVGEPVPQDGVYASRGPPPVPGGLEDATLEPTQAEGEEWQRLNVTVMATTEKFGWAKNYAECKNNWHGVYCYYEGELVATDLQGARMRNVTSRATDVRRLSNYRDVAWEIGIDYGAPSEHRWSTYYPGSPTVQTVYAPVGTYTGTASQTGQVSGFGGRGHVTSWVASQNTHFMLGVDPVIGTTGEVRNIITTENVTGWSGTMDAIIITTNQVDVAMLAFGSQCNWAGGVTIFGVGLTTACPSGTTDARCTLYGTSHWVCSWSTGLGAGTYLWLDYEVE